MSAGLFDEPVRVAPPAHDYPAPELVHGEHEVPVWGLGYDGETSSVMAAGHGADSRDAIEHYLVGELGHPADAAAVLLDLGLETRWVLFVDACGCTLEQHAQHLADDADCGLGGDGDLCAAPGLPPCDSDTFGFITRPADGTTPHAVPVSLVDLR